MSTTLEKRYTDLRRRRVDIRNRLKWAGHAIGDPTDRQVFIAQQEAQLRGTDREWQEMSHILHREHMLVGPVKVTAAPVRYAPVRAVPRARSVTYPGYVVKDMAFGGR